MTQLRFRLRRDVGDSGQTETKAGNDETLKGPGKSRIIQGGESVTCARATGNTMVTRIDVLRAARPDMNQTLICQMEPGLERVAGQTVPPPPR